MAAVISKNVLQTTRLQSLNAASIVVSSRNYSNNDTPHVIKNPTTASLKRGTGGRSSFSGIVCTVFGATGCIGRSLAVRLGKIGTQMIFPYRSDFYNARQLKVAGDLGQVLFHPFDLRDEESIRRCIKYSNVVVNLIGRDYETKNFSYNDVHVEGAARLARLCKEANIPRFIHLSALNASPNPKPVALESGSRWLKSKWEGECVVKQEFPEATIIRPAPVYGLEDRFLRLYCSRYVTLFRRIHLWNKGLQTEKQPIYVGDVAAGIVKIIQDESTAGKTYQFVGPKRYTMNEIVNWLWSMLRYDSRKYGHIIVDMKKRPLYWLKVSLIESISPSYPFGQLHWEAIERDQISDTVYKNLPTLDDLGVNLTHMESQVPFEIYQFKKDLHYIPQRRMYSPPNPKSIPLEFA